MYVVLISFILILKQPNKYYEYKHRWWQEKTKPSPISRQSVKDLLSMPCPPEEDPVFLTARLSNQACISLLFSFIRGQTEEAKTIIPQSPEWKPQSQKLTNNHVIITQITALYNSMKVQGTLCRATQDRWVMVKSSWPNMVYWRKECQSTAAFLPEPANSMKRKKI